MTRRKSSREFKVEAVRLVTEQGVAVAQAARDLAVAESVLRESVHETGSSTHRHNTAMICLLFGTGPFSVA